MNSNNLPMWEDIWKNYSGTRILLTPKGRIIDFSNEAKSSIKQNLGKDLKKGMAIQDIFPDKERKEITINIEKAQKEEICFEKEHHHKDQVIFHRGTYSPIKKGRKTIAIQFKIEDISKNREALREIKQAKDLHDTVFKVANILLIVLDNKGNIIEINQKGCEILESNKKDIIGKNWISEFIPPEEKKSLQKFFHKTLSSGINSSTTRANKIISAKGNIKIINWNNRVINKNNQQYAICSGEDITKKILLEQKILEKQKLFQDLFENSSDGIIIYKIDVSQKNDYRIQEMNKVAENMFKVTIDDIRGKKIADIYPELEKIWTDTIKKVIKTGKPIRLEHKMNCVSKFLGSLTYKASEDTVIYSFNDRTKAKETEKEMYKLAEVTKRSKNSVVITDLKGNITYVNPYFTEVTGYSSEEVIGKNPRILKSGHQKKEFYKQLWKKVSSGGVWEGTFINKKKNGELYYERASIFPIKDRDNSIINLAAIKQDITENVIAEESLKESELMFRKTIDSFNSIVSVIDKDFKVVLYNNFFKKTAQEINYKGEILGTNLFKIVNFIGPEIRKEYKQVFKTKKILITEEKYEINGKSIWSEVHKIPIFDEDQNVEKIVTVIHDISPRIQKENKLKEQEDHIRKIFQTSPDAVNVNRLKDGLYVDINEGFSQITGYKRDEVIGKTSTDLGIWAHKKDREELVRLLKKNGSVHNFESEFRYKDNSIKTGLMSANIIILNGEEHIISVTKDIQYEKELQKKQEEYRKKLEEKNNELESFNKFAVGREFRMIKLKEEVNGLLKKLGEEKKYDVI